MLNGVLLIHKEKGMTSHDVIDALRKRYKQKKFGHTGVLDPMADGLLVVLCGKATKILQFLRDTDKEYIASFQLGTSTDTDDIYGQVVDTKEINLDFDLDQVLQSFVGKQHLQVPMASNKKVNGKKLLDYKRQGIKAPVVYQDIEIYSMTKCSEDSFRIHCSSGTYVRSVCRELALRTNNLGCMKSLTRTKVGRFRLEQAQSLNDLQTQDPELYSTKMLLDHYPMIEMDDITEVMQGKPLDLPCTEEAVCLLHKDQPVAIYQKNGDRYVSKRGLW